MTNKPMLSVELLSCPFCGSPANLEDLRLVWCVRCTKCSACVLGDRAPEPHGDGISSNEIQDAQSRKMAENTDWASYEKSAVDAWNSRSTPATQHQGHADEQALGLVPAELVALLRADLRQEVESARLSLSSQLKGEPVAWVIGTEDGNGADYYPGKGLDTLEIGAKLYAEQPAPVATIARLMEAVHAIPGFPGVTGTQLRQLAEYLTGVKP